jgi:hypothetical protein
MRSRNTRTGRTVTLGLLLSLGAIGWSGCGRSGPKLIQVKGKVTLTGGAAVAYGHVILHPDASRGNTSKEVCQGTIRDGHYTIMTGGQKGAPVGAYVVSIEAAKEVDPNNPYFTEWLADEKYVDPNRSNLRLEVVEDPEPGRYDFQLTPHRPQKKK